MNAHGQVHTNETLRQVYQLPFGVSPSTSSGQACRTANGRSTALAQAEHSASIFEMIYVFSTS